MLRRLLIIGGILAAIVVATGGLMFFATSGATQLRVEGERMFIEGTLNTATLEGFEGLVEQHPGVTTVVLGDIPGAATVVPAVMLGYRLRGLGLDTEVAPGAELAGDAVFLFLGGVERRLGAGSRLRVSDWGGAGLDREAPGHQERRRYVQDMLGSEAFYWATVEGQPRVLGRAEIERFGLETP